MDKLTHVNVIGAGYAGIECALYLAKHGVRVHLFNSENKHDEHICFYDSEIFSAGDREVREHLAKEVKAFGGELIDEYLKDSSCKKVIESGLEKVKKNENIDLFDLCVYELNPKEINVLASGHRTDERLLKWLECELGSLKCRRVYPLCPILENVSEKNLIRRGRENIFFLPLNYDEYIKLCNAVIDERNCYLEFLKMRPARCECIENIVVKNKDALKNTIFKPLLLEGIEKPYSVIKLKKVQNGYEICDFCSELPLESQERIIRAIPSLSQIRLLREGRAQENSYLIAPLVFNEFFQSQKRENLFFAGNIAGLFGDIEGMASGLITAHFVLDLLKRRKMSRLSENTILSALKNKLISQNAINFSPIYASCDIIEDENRKNVLKNSVSLISKFEEEYNGKHV